MNADLECLTQLTDVDGDIDRIDKELKAARANFEQTQAAELEAMRLRDGLQAELTAARADERGLQRQLDEFRTRQLSARRVLETGAGSADAAERQYAQCAGLIDTTETGMLELMDRLDQLAASLTDAETEVAKAGASRRDLESQLPAKVELLRSEREALELQRDALRSALPTDLGNRYDMLRQSKKRNAVARVKDGTCTSCQRVLAPQRIADVRRGLLVDCNGCLRWLVLES
jgi:predicted  nucleic acid-binding Zn-ribbon protein